MSLVLPCLPPSSVSDTNLSASACDWKTSPDNECSESSLCLGKFVLWKLIVISVHCSLDSFCLSYAAAGASP